MERSGKELSLSQYGLVLCRFLFRLEKDGQKRGSNTVIAVKDCSAALRSLLTPLMQSYAGMRKVKEKSYCSRTSGKAEARAREEQGFPARKIQPMLRKRHWQTRTLKKIPTSVGGRRNVMNKMVFGVILALLTAFAASGQLSVGCVDSHGRPDPLCLGNAAIRAQELIPVVVGEARGNDTVYQWYYQNYFGGRHFFISIYSEYHNFKTKCQTPGI